MSSSCTQNQVARQEFDWSETPPSVAVAYTIAAIDNTVVTEVSPLYEYVDPQSLDSLVTDTGTVTISFTAYGYSVQLTDSTVIVREK
ncbi:MULTISPECIES: HalOD1 output domain-containing protein [Saliphagus]|uniref:HalOD1 output domain-containing protein n=1 Tax=Saliphagus infecundisoli TaxID=1849069 RepID=A0ABD5Q985_9EURY|nr:MULTISPECIES: HalOD1 output domain-containing protein [Saliphagus]